MNTMERYVEQLLGDTVHATENVEWPYRERELDIWASIPDDEDGNPYDYGFDPDEDDEPVERWKKQQ